MHKRPCPIALSTGAAVALCLVVSATVETQSPLGALWLVSACLSCVAWSVAPSRAWQVACCALAVSFLPHSGEMGHVARGLLPAAAAYFASQWPTSKRTGFASRALAAWPFVVWWVHLAFARAPFHRGLDFVVDSMSLSLTFGAGLLIAKRSRDATRQAQQVCWLIVALIGLSAAVAITGRPTFAAVSVVFSPVYAILAVPLYCGARTRPAILAAAFALAALALAL